MSSFLYRFVFLGCGSSWTTVERCQDPPSWRQILERRLSFDNYKPIIGSTHHSKHVYVFYHFILRLTQRSIAGVSPIGFADCLETGGHGAHHGMGLTTNRSL